MSKPRRTLLDLKESITSTAPVVEANGGDSKSASPKENGMPESSTEVPNSSTELGDRKKGLNKYLLNFFGLYFFVLKIIFWENASVLYV